MSAIHLHHCVDFRDGGLKRGDQLLAVNGVVSSITHSFGTVGRIIILSKVYFILLCSFFVAKMEV